MKAAFYTLGCKVNQYETEAIREEFERRGYEAVPENGPADVYVVNTCTVTGLADRKSRQFIRRAHATSPDAVIVVTGCYSEIKPEEVAVIEGVSIVTGTNGKSGIVDKVEKFLKDREASTDVVPYEGLTTYEELGTIKGMEGRTRAYIKIEEGCDRFCSYCVIPMARGKVRSRDMDEIADEVRGLVEKGYKEIVLTGINTALYGKDKGDEGIEPLIALIDSIPGDFRIRLSSLEPTVIDADYAVKLLKYQKLCHHLHLSCQSGSDRVLKLMNRNYDRDEYLEIIRRVREIDPLFGFSTDMIAGFPGETDEDSADSVDLIKEAQFCRTHVFRYSNRPGTRAAEMPDQIPAAVKKERSEKLQKAGEESRNEFIGKCLGKEFTVITERIEESMLAGYTDNYIKVYLGQDSATCGEFYKVRLTEAYKDGAKAEIIRKI